jgi:hypothetical protein
MAIESAQHLHEATCVEVLRPPLLYARIACIKSYSTDARKAIEPLNLK